MYVRYDVIFIKYMDGNLEASYNQQISFMVESNMDWYTVYEASLRREVLSRLFSSYSMRPRKMFALLYSP